MKDSNQYLVSLHKEIIEDFRVPKFGMMERLKI